MTLIQFHILPDGLSAARDLYACQQAEQAYRAGRKVLIHTSDIEHSVQLDALLWSFRDSSFVPHSLLGSSSETESAATNVNAIHIGCGDDAEDQHDLLINLSPRIPGFFSRFVELQEIIIDQEDDRERGRERYRYYKDHGYPLEHLRIRQRILSQ